MDPKVAQFIKISYPIESILKFLFIVMAIIRADNVLLVGFLASLLGLLRMLKMPQFNK